MTVSVFELFSIGIGPSSSHTVGPMRAAEAFAHLLAERSAADPVVDIEVVLHGSLAATGIGHGTPDAVLLGLEGNDPTTIDPEYLRTRAARIRADGMLHLAGADVPWGEESMLFRAADRLPRHPNALSFSAHLASGALVQERWYSVGGGFIERDGDPVRATTDDVPLPFENSAELLATCVATGLRVDEVMRRNELARLSEDEVDQGLGALWQAMSDSIERGLHTEGVLPGGLRVPRRAAALLKAASAHGRASEMDRLGAAAMAVNEENAAGGRVVTAPTNGAAGIVPSVLRYALDDVVPEAEAADAVRRFLLTAAAVGAIIKSNASISGADVGCQGEVGSACAMAAAGLAAVMGATPRQIENAAEIGLEHHLGMTCDPIGGLVQIPCIERNGVAAVKAVYAARTACWGDGVHHVTLDQAVETMRQTGADMNQRYKETSEGGLAVNVPDC